MNHDTNSYYWWTFSKELRERLCYQARINYDNSDKRWMDLTEKHRTRIAPRLMLEIDAYEGFNTKGEQK